MNSRQALLFLACFTLPLSITACTQPVQISPTQTVVRASFTATATVTPTPSPVPPSPTPTAPGCFTAPGEVRQGAIPATKPVQQFLIYLPPCYGESGSRRYPVLYLLHGQTYTEDQWVRLGAPAAADNLIHTAQAVPFIIVFPDDHYWNAPAGGSFGERLIQTIIPYVDENYATIADRAHRSLGGLSRGGGWTLELGFQHPDLFGSLGLHSPAIFTDNAPYIEDFIKKVPEDDRPRLWFDIGDQDKELGSDSLLEEVLTRNSYLHEFHVYSGDHTEGYWGAHVEEYLRWYAQAWQAVPAQ